MPSFNEILHKIEASFHASMKGQEQLKNLVYWWGIPAYIFFYIVVNGMIKKIDIHIIDIILSSLGMVYFAWHIFVVWKCSPKKPKLTKEEKKLHRQQALRNAPRAFLRKLFLQEPITKWNPVAMTIVLDMLLMMHFLGYILS